MTANITNVSNSDYNLIQTFYIDANAVGGSSEISLSSIELYFKTKPDANKNSSGIIKPGVVISICSVSNNQPNYNSIYDGSTIKKEYDSIFALSDASVSTSFSFSRPVTLATNAFYGIVIKYEDSGYSVFNAKQGNVLVGTNIASSGAQGLNNANLYQKTNSDSFVSLSSTTLKFKVNIANYNSNSAVINLTNKNYEFFTISNVTGNFIGGEKVFKSTANLIGTVKVGSANNILIGNGTSFTYLSSGDTLLLNNGSEIDLVVIDGVVNDTSLKLLNTPSFTNSVSTFAKVVSGKVFKYEAYKPNIILVDSNAANSSFAFAIGSTIIGENSGAVGTIVSLDNYSVDKITPNITVNSQNDSTVNVSGAFAYPNLQYSNTNLIPLNLLKSNDIKGYDARIYSRSLEVNETINTNLAGNANNKKSSIISVNLSKNQNANSNLFSIPTIKTDEIDILSGKYLISNTYSYVANGITYDSEIKPKNGLAITKHISTKVNFANNTFAEDIRVIVTAYRPLGTSIKAYAKLFNSADPESFDDKSWTPLLITENSSSYSALNNENDQVEFTYGLGQFPESSKVLQGFVKTQFGNNVVTTTNDFSGQIANNSLVKIYNALIPYDYSITTVISANSTALVLNNPISDNNVVGNGLSIDLIKYPNIAFNNIENSNVARYYSSSLVAFDTFTSFQVKLVLLSDSTFIVPKVFSLEAIGVSA